MPYDRLLIYTKYTIYWFTPQSLLFQLQFQDYHFPDVRDRQYLLTMHKSAKKINFDVAQYNQLKEAIYQTKYDLERLRDPLQLQLPIQHIDKKKLAEALQWD